ncbi:MAG: ATP-binding protein [Acidobacteria bacterium]|nr:ATP-binding protein [Acidobacteriota bacterium]
MSDPGTRDLAAPGAALPPRLPAWAVDLIAQYESGATCQFVLHGNVHDRMPVPREGAAALGSLRDFLLQVLLPPFDVVLAYDLGNGIRVEKGGEVFSRWPALGGGGAELPKGPRAAVETLTRYFRYAANLARLGRPAPRIGCIVEAAELIAPAGEGGLAADTGATVLLMREWANDSLIASHPIVTFLVAENLADLHPLLANNLHVGRVRVPLPDAAALGAVFADLAPAYAAALAPWQGKLDALAGQLVGATLGSIEQLLKATRHAGRTVDPQDLVRLKRDLVERDSGGLVSFVESKRTLDDIHGHAKVTAWLRQDIALWRQNDLKAMPMGYLLCGPVGTGKTFFVEGLAGEAGVPVVRIRNFRDKWVGSTEGNLEKIFRLLHALGRCIVFVDEADQALGRRDASANDSGVSGRIYGMIAEEMSDTKNRGKIVWVLASSRPDLIEVDLKRPGRIDVKIPLFPTLDPREGFDLIRALCRRVGIEVPAEAFAQLEAKVPELLTPGAAEALAVKAYRLSRTQGLEPLAALAACLEGYQVPVPRDVMEFQIGLAVREATDLDFVPPQLRPPPARVP